MNCRPKLLFAICIALPLSSGCSDRLSLGSFPGGGGGSGGGDGGGGGGGDDPPPPPAPLVTSTPLGLTSAVGGPGSIRVDWRAPSPEVDPPSLVLFITPPADLPWYPPPVPLEAQATHHVIHGLPDGLYELRLGVLPAPGELHLPVGPRLTVRTGAPIYVDVTANPDIADGTTPGTAYNDLILAVLMASVTGGGNVWVARGEFLNMSLPVFPNVDVYGGFDHDFVLDERDPAVHQTRLVGLPNLAVASFLNGEELAILDGLHLDGAGVAASGMEVEDSPFEGRELHASNCKRGFKIRRNPAADPVSVDLISCTARMNELEGLSGEGALDLRLDACRFSDNAQEGVDIGNWLAPEGENVKLSVRDCAFLRNATEGLDVDLNAPPTGGVIGGHFEIKVDACSFHENGAAGLLIDIDYEAYPAWTSDILVRGCYSRDNGGPGVHLDLDSSAVVLIHRLASNANGEHGLLATSETAAGTLTVSASAFLGNRGAGISSELGNFGVIASHCVFLGNQGGGLASPLAPAAAVSSAALIQGSPWQGVTQHYCAEQAAMDPAPFVRVPRFIGDVVGLNEEQVLLSAPPPASAGVLAEIADDGTTRSILTAAGSALALDPAPTGISLPKVIAIFDDGETVDEDYRLSPASVLLGAGMPPISGGTADAGVHGASSGGPPGGEELLPEPLFFFAGSSPPWTLPIGAQVEIQLRFAKDIPDPASAPLFVQVVRPDLVAVPVDAWVNNGTLHLAPPVEGWETGFVIELHDGLPSQSGLELAVPVAIPLSIE